MTIYIYCFFLCIFLFPSLRPIIYLASEHITSCFSTNFFIPSLTSIRCPITLVDNSGVNKRI